MHSLFSVLLVGIFIIPIPTPQKTEEPHEMIATDEGLIAMDTPKGWQRADGPGLAFFIREKDVANSAAVFMYISSTPYGPNEDAKTVEEVINSDISDFKQRFKNGGVQKNEEIELPRAKARAAVYTFLAVKRTMLSSR